MPLDEDVQAELTRAAVGLGVEAVTGLLRESIERRAGRRLADMNAAEAIERIRAREAERTFETTDELVTRGAAQAGGAEPNDEGEDGA